MDFSSNLLDEFTNNEADLLMSNNDDQILLPTNTFQDNQGLMFEQQDQSQTVMEPEAPKQKAIIVSSSAPAPEPVKKKRSPRKKKDPNAPAAASSAYNLFFKDTQATIKTQNPGAKFSDISKIVASMWEALGEDEKVKFKQRSDEDKARYKMEMEAYKAGLTLPPKPEVPEVEETEEAKEVFSSTEATTQIASHVKILQEAEEKTQNTCIKQGCEKVAIKSSEWDDEYCSNECAVGHCKDVFTRWVSEQSR